MLPKKARRQRALSVPTAEPNRASISSKYQFLAILFYLTDVLINQLFFVSFSLSNLPLLMESAPYYNKWFRTQTELCSAVPNIKISD